jgi:hypothetical protein
MAKKRTRKTSKQAPVAVEPIAAPTTPEQKPLRWFTEQYNALVPRAVALGIPAQIHSSLFESRAKGAKQLAWLMARIEAAEAEANQQR